MPRTLVALALSIVLAATSCGPDTEPGAVSRYVERDSAGITVVENLFEAIPGGWSVAAQPVWAMGGLAAPDDQQLFRVAGARRLSDGRIVIANAGSGEVRVYGPGRALLASHGGKGDGPGEYQEPNLLDVRDDSIFVFDQQHHRVSVLHVETGFERSYEVDWTGAGFPVPRGILGDGSVVIGGGMSFSSEEGFPTGLIRPTSTFGWIAPDGTTQTHVAELPAAEMFAQANDQGFMARGLPFGRATAAASTMDGLWIGEADSYELKFFGVKGSLTRIVRLDAPRTAVTGAMLDRHVEEEVEDEQIEERRQEIRRIFREMPIPSALPPYQQLFVDRSGFLWVEDYRPADDDTPEWTIFDESGHVVGRLETPARTRLLDAGDDYILGRTLDELDVESLTLWELSRPRG